MIAEQLLEQLAERREPSARTDLEAAYSPSKASTQAQPSGVMRKRCFRLLGFSGIVISIQPFSRHGSRNCFLTWLLFGREKLPLRRSGKLWNR